MYKASFVVWFQKFPEGVVLPRGALPLAEIARLLRNHVSICFSSQVLDVCGTADSGPVLVEGRVEQSHTVNYCPHKARLCLRATVPSFFADYAKAVNDHVETYLTRWLNNMIMGDQAEALACEDGLVRLGYEIKYANVHIGEIETSTT